MMINKIAINFKFIISQDRRIHVKLENTLEFIYWTRQKWQKVDSLFWICYFSIKFSYHNYQQQVYKIIFLIRTFVKSYSNYIFKRNWILRRVCIYKEPTLTKYWNLNIFLQILYSYFRYNRRLFLGYAVFAARCDTIRTSWETKKERLT